jgi:hypothetical protein
MPQIIYEFATQEEADLFNLRKHWEYTFWREFALWRLGHLRESLHGLFSQLSGKTLEEDI